MTKDIRTIFQQEKIRIDETVLEYVLGMLEDLEDPSALEESISPFLLDAGCTDEAVKDICTTLEKTLFSGEISKDDGIKQLDNPVVLMEMEDASHPLFGGKTDITHLSTRGNVPTVSTVDQAKLAKAEQKLKEKQEKRREKAENNVTSSVDTFVPMESSFSPANYELAAKSRSRDIKVEGFDIGYSVF
jgi:hypothetical protein